MFSGKILQAYKDRERFDRKEDFRQKRKRAKKMSHLKHEVKNWIER